jgi:hypothetical protein
MDITSQIVSEILNLKLTLKLAVLVGSAYISGQCIQGKNKSD